MFFYPHLSHVKCSIIVLITYQVFLKAATCKKPIISVCYQSLQVAYQLYQITHSLWQDISISTFTNYCRWHISYIRSHILYGKIFLCQPLPIIAGGISAISDHTFSVARYFYVNLYQLLQVSYQLYQITHSLRQDISRSTSTNYCRWHISYIRSHILCGKIFLCQPLPIIAGVLSAISDHTFSTARYFSTNYCRWHISYIRSHILYGKIFLCQPLPIIAGGISAISDHTFSVARYFYVNLYQSLQVAYQLYQITHSLWQDISIPT